MLMLGKGSFVDVVKVMYEEVRYSDYMAMYGTHPPHKRLELYISSIRTLNLENDLPLVYNLSGYTHLLQLFPRATLIKHTSTCLARSFYPITNQPSPTTLGVQGVLDFADHYEIDGSEEQHQNRYPLTRGIDTIIHYLTIHSEEVIDSVRRFAWDEWAVDSDALYRDVLLDEGAYINGIEIFQLVVVSPIRLETINEFIRLRRDEKYGIRMMKEIKDWAVEQGSYDLESVVGFLDNLREGRVYLEIRPESTESAGLDSMELLCEVPWERYVGKLEGLDIAVQVPFIDYKAGKAEEGDDACTRGKDKVLVPGSSPIVIDDDSDGEGKEDDEDDGEDKDSEPHARDEGSDDDEDIDNIVLRSKAKRRIPVSTPPEEVEPHSSISSSLKPVYNTSKLYKGKPLQLAHLKIKFHHPHPPIEYSQRGSAQPLDAFELTQYDLPPLSWLAEGMLAVGGVDCEYTLGFTHMGGKKKEDVERVGEWLTGLLRKEIRMILSREVEGPKGWEKLGRE